MGSYLTTSARSHPSLFWALRGGGGGTYGIVTSVTYKTHPEAPLTANTFIASLAPGSKAGYKKLLAEYIRINPALSDAGWVVYGNWNGAVFALSGLGVNVAQAPANATWNPFVAFAQNLTGEGVQVQGATTIPFNSWYEWYKSQPVYPVGGNEELGSRLLTRDVLEGNYEGLAETFVKRGLNGGLLCVFRISIFFLPPSPSSFSSSFL